MESELKGKEQGQCNGDGVWLIYLVTDAAAIVCPHSPWIEDNSGGAASKSW
ncbi:hypothetical protein HBI56_194190 [Parastagonospora nodorum]|nr:hypothetical protein HBH53_189640 [Parastagonospora nodorum]KAH3962256.1 hypothetical protein HBH51_176130 [Parastagonospora nodorum]KAH3967188.1 hypothetical protein HBH52_191720 [Parastagonospora nodorum]KAH3993140.1 hypothetical protein HBI10_207580 [Parastagonospora nodorum]KAH4010874.1 hypothetical protein HBI13_203890 [Parastagonospora nodorum]